MPTKLLIIHDHAATAAALEPALNNMFAATVVPNPEEAVNWIDEEVQADDTRLLIHVNLGPWRSQRRGLKLAKCLRWRYQRKNPILFVSFEREEVIKSADGGVLLNLPGHGFLQLPASVEHIRDALNNLCSVEDDETLAEIIFPLRSTDLSNQRHVDNNRVSMLRIAHGAYLCGHLKREQVKEIHQQFKISIFPLEWDESADLPYPTHPLGTEYNRNDMLKWEVMFIDDQAEEWHPVLQPILQYHGYLLKSYLGKQFEESNPPSEQNGLIRSADEYRQSLESNRRLLVLLDLKFNGDESVGLKYLKQLAKPVGGRTVSFRDIEPWNRRPVVIFTVVDSRSIERECRRYRIFEYLEKEFDEKERDAVEYYQSLMQTIHHAALESLATRIRKKLILPFLDSCKNDMQLAEVTFYHQEAWRQILEAAQLYVQIEVARYPPRNNVDLTRFINEVHLRLKMSVNTLGYAQDRLWEWIQKKHCPEQDTNKVTEWWNWYEQHKLCSLIKVYKTILSNLRNQAAHSQIPFQYFDIQDAILAFLLLTRLLIRFIPGEEIESVSESNGKIITILARCWTGLHLSAVKDEHIKRVLRNQMRQFAQELFGQAADSIQVSSLLTRVQRCIWCLHSRLRNRRLLSGSVLDARDDWTYLSGIGTLLTENPKYAFLGLYFSPFAASDLRHKVNESVEKTQLNSMDGLIFTLIAHRVSMACAAFDTMNPYR